MRWAWLSIVGVVAGSVLHETAHWIAARLVGATNVKTIWDLNSGLIGTPAINYELGKEPAKSYLVLSGPSWKYRIISAAPLVPAFCSSLMLAVLRPSSASVGFAGFCFVLAQLPLSKTDRYFMWR